MSLRPNRYRAVIGSDDDLAAFDQALDGLARSRLSRLDTLDVAIGFPYAWHMVLPWQDAILSPAERDAYAQAMLAAQYGFAQDWQSDWTCLLTQESFGATCIASAIRRDVADVIAATAKRRGLRLRHLRPLLADVIASHPGRLPDDAVFMAAGEHACEFAFRRDAQWRQAFHLPRQACSHGALQTDADCLLAAALLARHFPAHVVRLMPPAHSVQLVKPVKLMPCGADAAPDLSGMRNAA